MFYDINPFILLQGCFKWHGYSSFKRKGKNLTFKKCVFVKLFKTKMKQKIKPFENAIIQQKLIK
jgi:hypothetical protein